MASWIIQIKGREECKCVASLTLDVDGDTGLFAVGHCLIGGSADDLLTGFDVGGGNVEGAYRALSPPVSKKSLREEKNRQVWMLGRE